MLYIFYNYSNKYIKISRSAFRQNKKKLKSQSTLGEAANKLFIFK